MLPYPRVKTALLLAEGQRQQCLRRHELLCPSTPGRLDHVWRSYANCDVKYMRPSICIIKRSRTLKVLGETRSSKRGGFRLECQRFCWCSCKQVDVCIPRQTAGHSISWQSMGLMRYLATHGTEGWRLLETRLRTPPLPGNIDKRVKADLDDWRT